MKILLIHASAGAGHFKAAESLYHSIKKSTGHDAVLVDALDYTNPLFKKLYVGTYYFLISKAPWLWGFLFWLLDLNFLQPIVRAVRRLYNAMNTGKLNQFLKEEQFDYILTTHFMPAEVVSALKRTGQITSQLIVIVTDFDVHRIWLASKVNRYCVASEWTKEKIIQLGIAQENVNVSGIPTDEKFSSSVNIGALKKKLGLLENIFTVLVATSSFGIGPIKEIVDKLNGFQVIVVCGHNKRLYQTLSREQYGLVKVYGFVDNMHELMAVSDCMVTKPGGLSIAEALVSQLALIFFSVIPGQEAGNVRVLKKYGIGISGCNISQINEELVRMKYSRDLFLTTLKKTKSLARPCAVKDIISIIK